MGPQFAFAQPPSSPYAGEEIDTGKTNQPLTLYQAMLARFDPLSDPERTDLIELICGWTDAPPEDRVLVLALVRRLARG
jgi:hypothetical protein